MKKFLLLLHEDVEAMGQLSPKEMERLIKMHMDWTEQLVQSGHFVSGEGLEESGKQIKGREKTIKDGPYLETKEMIGGFYLIQAENIEAAMKIADDCPCHYWGGTTEIRPIANYEG